MNVYYTYVFIGFILGALFVFAIADKFKILAENDSEENESYELKFAFYWLFQVNAYMLVMEAICIVFNFYQYDIPAIGFLFVSIIPILRYLWSNL